MFEERDLLEEKNLLEEKKLNKNIFLENSIEEFSDDFLFVINKILSDEDKEKIKIFEVE